MEVQKDFKELLALFKENRVDYVIVGAYALAFYGAPRQTGDIDLLVKPDAENGIRIVEALAKFGFKSLGFSKEDFAKPDQIIQLGYPPVRIDLITSLTGAAWEEVAENRVLGTYADLEVYYIGKEQFIINKRATGRKKDLADLEAIGED